MACFLPNENLENSNINGINTNNRHVAPRALLLLHLCEEHRCVRQVLTRKTAMIILFIISILLFAYLGYVLINPEKF